MHSTPSPPKKTRLQTQNVPQIPPHFLQRWWCKWWLYHVHILRGNQVLSQHWEVVCWILHGKECLRQPNNIYYTLYIIYKIYISLKKSYKRHEQMTSPLMPNTCTERGHEAQYKKWRAGWKSFIFHWEDFWHRGILYWNHLRSKKERVSFIETFFDKVEEMVIAGNISSARRAPRGPHSPHHARQHITCVLIIS